MRNQPIFIENYIKNMLLTVIFTKRLLNCHGSFEQVFGVAV